MKISFVTTIYRTAGDIESFAARAAEAAHKLGLDLEVVFVNDGSPDDGREIAIALAERNPAVVLVDLSRNFGQHKALWTGLGVATGDFVVVMDGDMEEDPLWVVEFYRVLNEQRAEVVYGVQRAPKGNFLYRRCRSGFYRLLDLVSDLDFPRHVMTARLMTRRYVDALLSFEEREIFFVGIMHVTGFRQVPLELHKAHRSPTKYTFKKLFRLFLMAITSFSIAPLVGVFLIGVAISLGALLFICVLIANYFIRGVGVEGWTSVMAAVMMLGGIFTFTNGLIAIYVGTIFLEVKKRPRTIVAAIYRAEPNMSDRSP